MLSQKNTNLLNLLIQFIPYYGEFSVMEKTMLIPDEIFFDVAENLSSVFEQTETINDYLVENGFAIKRKDIDPTKSLVELTERGRWLKEQGSIESYKKYQEQKKIRKAYEEQERQDAIERNKQINRLTSWIAIFTGISAIYYIFEIMQWLFHHEHWKLPY